jgi:hypothetical protein
MKNAFYGRIFFGASAVLFGVIALMWHDPDTWQTLHPIWSLPLGSIIGAFLMAAQIAGGIAMQYPRTARLASITLGVDLDWHVLVGVAVDILRHSLYIGRYRWIVHKRCGFLQPYCQLIAQLAFLFQRERVRFHRYISLANCCNVGVPFGRFPLSESEVSQRYKCD